MPNNTRIALITAYATTPNFDDYFVLDGNTCGTRNILVTTALSACNPYRAGPNTCGILSYGTGNAAGGNFATVAGGCSNNAAANYSFIGGGTSNNLTGPYSGILGGANNNDSGNCSVFILGSNIVAPAVNTTYVSNLSTSGSICANTVNVVYTSNSANNCGALYVGAPAGTTGNYNFNNCGQIAVFAGYDNVESFVTIANTNPGACAYTAFTVGNNSYVNNYAELVVNSTNYNAAAAGYVNNSLNAPSAAALYNYGGDMAVATWTNNNIHFLVNAASAVTDAMIICSNNSVSAVNALYGSPVYSNGLLVCTTAGGSPATPTAAGPVYGCTNGSGSNNNATIGLSAGNALTAGTCNVFVGANAGGNIATGGCNTFVGAGIGFNCSSTTCNTVLIGTNGTSSTTPYLCLAGGTLYIAQSGAGNPVSLNITGYVPTFNCLTNLTTTSAVSFTTTGTSTWTVPPGIQTASALLVAGGGGSTGLAGNPSGGGGAGGVVYCTNLSLSPGTTCTIIVGVGGTGQTGVDRGCPGSNTIFSGLTALGGGAGYYSSFACSFGNGGSAGGSGAGNNTGCTTPNVATQPTSPSGGFGNVNGLSQAAPNYPGGGGGGAGGAGNLANGGIGYFNTLTNAASAGIQSGGNFYVAAGGGAAGNSGSPGGTGGGGAGGNGGTNGGNATGYGSGGGGGGGNINTTGGSGSQGILILGLQTGAPTIGATYVTNDTCTIYYYNGTSWVNRGIYNNAYNTTTCNLFTGCGSLSAVSTGVGNTTLGGFAGANITTGCCNTALGFNAGNTITTVNNTIAVGYGAVTSNTTGHTVWGNASNNVCNCVYAAWSTVSDCRDKTNIAPLPSTLGLTFVRQLSPVSYQNDHRDLYVNAYGCTFGVKDGTLADSKQHYGLIAQDVQLTVETLSTRFDALGYDSEQDGYRLTYEELIAPIIASIKELDARITKLENS
jgi:Chaperone of endosialidase